MAESPAALSLIGQQPQTKKAASGCLENEINTNISYRWFAWSGGESCRLVSDWSATTNKKAAAVRTWGPLPAGYLQSKVQVPLKITYLKTKQFTGPRNLMSLSLSLCFQEGEGGECDAC